MKTYRERINLIHRELAIPVSYENDYGLALQQEAVDLVEIDKDFFGRMQRLTPVAARAWQAMKAQAGKEGVVLDVVSAFRGVDKQADIIQNKVAAGQAISDILQVCAAPGYSEHHTGRALDLTAEGCEPLSEIFESTTAFNWLTANASRYLFTLSYPRCNAVGLTYEPWHWAHSLKTERTLGN